MFCAPRPVLGGIAGAGSRSHVLRSRTHFRQNRRRRVSFHVLRSRPCLGLYQGRRVLFSCFTLPDSFSVVPWASGPIFLFCDLGLVFDDTEGVGCFFLFCAAGLVFDGTEDVRSCLLVLRSRTHFWRDRGHRVPVSCFVLPSPFWPIPMASGAVFMFCAPRLVFDGIEGVGCRFHSCVIGLVLVDT
jgi:hypothetical protein